MNHLCDCGRIAEVEGIIATCSKCGSYYLYPDEVRTPPEVVEVEETPPEKVKPRPAQRR